MSTLPEELKLETLLSKVPQFRPIAYYDKHLDVIRVQIMDCSIWEERFDRIMTIYHMNHHPKQDGLNDIVGFSIKGVRHLLNELGMKDEGAIVITDLLDALVKLYPTTATRRVIEYYRSLGAEAPREAELPKAA